MNELLATRRLLQTITFLILEKLWTATKDPTFLITLGLNLL